jgi:hypothetical protein
MRKPFQKLITSFLIFAQISMVSVSALANEKPNPILTKYPASQEEVNKVIAGLSKEEIESALHELSAVMASLKQDLAEAEKRNDGRLAVKVRKYSLSIAGASLLTMIVIGAMNALSRSLGKSGPYAVFGSEFIFAIQMPIAIIAILSGVGGGLVAGATTIFMSPSEAIG